MSAFSLLRRAAGVCAVAVLAAPAFAQPTLVQDLRPGSLTSAPRGFQVLGGELYFTAERTDVGAEPFHYNGQYAALATDIITAPEQGSNPQGNYVPHKRAVYFTAAVKDAVNGESGLWRFDGTTTTLVWRGSTPSFPTSFSGDLYFVARHPTAGGMARVWRWDGRDNYLVHEIPQGTSDPKHLAVLNGVLYFTLDTDGTGAKLWRFAPGQAATAVSGVSFTPASVEPRCGLPEFDFIHAYRGALYLAAPDHALHRFDGTTLTKLADGRPKWMGGFGGAVFYTTGTRVTICGAHPQHSLWSYDGQNRKIGTFMDFGPTATNMGIGINESRPFTPFRGALYYRSDTDIWRFTGTAFERVSNANLRGNGLTGTLMGLYKGRIYFGFPLNEAQNEELFSYDGRGPVYQTVAALGSTAMSATVLNEEQAALEAGAPLGEAVASEADARAADGLALTLASANPARGTARVSLTVAASDAARVSVFDALGREVAVLHDGPLVAGTHALAWSGEAPAGLYLVRAETGGKVATVPVVRAH